MLLSGSKIAFGSLLAVIAAMLWGSAGTAQSFITQDGLNTLWVGAFRLLFACAFFFPLLALHSLSHSKKQTSNSVFHYRYKILLAGLSMAFFNLLFFTGVKEAGVALGSCTTIGSAPLWAGLFEYIFHKKKPTKDWIVGITIAVFGGIAMALSQAQAIEFNPLGLGICVFAGFFYSLYSMTAKEIVKNVTPLQATSFTFLIAASIAGPVAWIASGLPTIYLSDLIIVMYLGVIVTGIAYLLYSTALKIINVSTAVALGLLEPVVAFILAIVVVHEPITLGSALGLSLILIGLAFVLRSENKHRS